MCHEMGGGIGEVYCSDWWANVLVHSYIVYVHVQGLLPCSLVRVVQGVYCVCGCRVRSLSHSG